MLLLCVIAAVSLVAEARDNDTLPTGWKNVSLVAEAQHNGTLPTGWKNVSLVVEAQHNDTLPTGWKNVSLVAVTQHNTLPTGWENMSDTLVAEAQHNGTLPRGWEKVCSTTVPFVDWRPEPPSFNWSQPMLQLSCQIQNSEVLDITDLRAWSRRQNKPVALDVMCSPNITGYMRFPWPFKAPNLVYLKITNCQIIDFYTEFLLHVNFTQELRVLIMESVVKYMLSSQVVEFAENLTQISRDSHCLSVLLEKYVDRNANMTPILDTGVVEFLVASNKWQKTEQLIPHKCNYDFLQYMDESNKNKDSLFFYHEIYKGSFPELRVYNLSNMGFSMIPEELQDWRFHYPKMQYLDLSWNNFSTFYFSDYYGYDDMSVGIVDLRHNNITELTEAQFNQLSRFQTVAIDLRDNPLSCECDTSKDMLRFYLEKSNSFFLPEQYGILGNMTCAFPDHLVGELLGELRDEDLTCPVPEEPEDFIILVSLMSIVLVLVVAMTFLMFYYRREISVLLFTKFGIIFSRGCPEGKDFDAFLSYSSRDDNWVISTLVKRLESGEKGPAFKLCVHHRDFEIGAAIADNVVKSVETSRHTVLVLSKNYIKSEWCIYEFRTAMHQSLIEKRKHMIIIILETVPKEELEADLRKCLETFTYITVGDKMFWSKLIYALSCGRPRSSSETSETGKEADC